MARPIHIEQVNALDSDQFKQMFENIIECHPKAAAALCYQRPFVNIQHLAEAADFYLEQLPSMDKEEVLCLHPDLAGQLSDQGELTSESCREQQSAGLHCLTPQEKIRINKLNESYRDKFGFPFVICARENKVATIIQGLEMRLNNLQDVELETGIAEVKKICRLRIRELVLGE